MRIDLLNTILERTLSALGYELLGISYKSMGIKKILEVYIDSANNITLEDCEKASRQISATLDVEDIISNQYTLEVSSPGIERPLFKIEHYGRFVGHHIQLTTKKLINGKRHFLGLLEKVIDNDSIQLRMENVLYEFAIEDIAKARLHIKR